jgi:methionine sulfoxide reductase heme-binding subunit
MASWLNQRLRRVPVWAVWVLLLLPLAGLTFAVATGNLGPDPVKHLERELGEWGIRLLILTLAVTPLRRFTGVSLIRFRRAFGLLTFTYVTLHLAVWVSLDLAFRWAEIGADLIKRPYIIVGMIGFLVMVPLAVTSNASSLRRMGAAAWGRLHRLVYIAALAGALHFLMLSKVWWGDPVIYAGLIVILLGLRLPLFLPARSRQAGA